MTKGIFGIGTPEGWYKKLQANYQRLLESPEDIHTAVDFFATAESLRDWARVERKHNLIVAGLIDQSLSSGYAK